MTEPLDAVRMRGIVKNFGPVQALRGADFSLRPGEVHALLGENGAGKSTLMHVLFGLTTRDSGIVEVGGRALPPGSPRAAMAAGIGMVHQHFAQVPRMTVAENVALGRAGLRYDRIEAEAEVRRVGKVTGLELDPSVRAGELPAGLRQRLEVVKALARHVRVLIMDEPTAALTPREIDELFAALRGMAKAGMGIVLITHKMREVLAIADRVTVLRRGDVVMSREVSNVSTDELAQAMLGDGRPEIAEREAVPSPPRERTRDLPVLEVRDLRVRGSPGRPPAVTGASFEVWTREIVGIAAVEGNGQRELMRAVVGLLPHEGVIAVARPHDVGFAPEDRQNEGLILDFPVIENMALGRVPSFWVDRSWLEHTAALAVEEYGIRVAGEKQPVRALSGGNQQKLILARVLGRHPALLVLENPTRGLDIRATSDLHARLRRAAHDDGLGVLLYSTDLDEVLALSDRVAVMVGGRWRWVPDDARTRANVGAMMLGALDS